MKHSNQFLTGSSIELSWGTLKTNNWLSLMIERDLLMQLVSILLGIFKYNQQTKKRTNKKVALC